MAKIDQLEPLLQSLQALKPPGASKTKIAAITTLCVENVQSESVIAQRLYRHLKRTPGTHKLGVLYVVDSVTRQWLDKAHSAKQDVSGSSAPDGTFASGVHKITELLPALIDDLLQNAPPDHKAKVENLIQIWERGNTFPAKVLADLKKKLAEPASALHVPSSTPPGSPSMNTLVSLGLKQPLKQTTASQPAAVAAPTQTPASAPAQPDASSILAALAGLQPMPAAVTPVQQPAQRMAPISQPPPPPAPPANTTAASGAPDLAALLAGIAQPQQTPQPAPAAQFAPPPQQMYQQPYQAAAPANLPAPIVPRQQFQPYYQPPTPVQTQASAAPGPLDALASLLPPHVLSNPTILNQVLSLLQGLQQEGIPQEQWGAVIVALFPPPQNTPVAASTPATWGAAAQDNYAGNTTNPYGGYRERSRERGRGRSRSPDSRAPKSANRRPSPVYGTYDASIANAQSEDLASHSADKRGRGRGGRNYRQRTPPGARNGFQDVPQAAAVPGPKWTDIDPTLPPGHLKVLSRTLFVGGATGTEAELRAIFARFGQVQTCIANEDKRHAFVKMATRNDAVAAKSAMETMRDPDVLSKARQTKWGVGFGPRECCDYATGISVIPIDTLTDADHKWMLTAEFGGTGGRPIESGLVVEEPDIEIGAGVSSKAMSRRVGPDGGNRRARGGGGGGQGRFRQPEPARESPRPDPVTIPPPPPVPGFGFNFAMPGMPQFP
ncbi:hypothetical protein AAFC00_001314 [Neodothiora populina]|uniref:Uncharacterized protein n=1 Tax=Neodothiora populina TaxID=2781224 RepID=A0ABR3PPI9_9PEZI